MPYGLYLLGSRSGTRRNLMTLNWATQVSFEPKLLGVGVERGALTHQLVAEGGAFSLSLPDREDRAVVRKFVKPAEADLEAGTLNGIPYTDGSSTGAPILATAVAWVECQVRQEVECGTHTLFIGEVVDCGFGADEDTAVLRMEDTRMSYGG
jgi:flavin reductase (DIM6/NTAB) family NADH-FMN oxidoreductase RutF